MLSASDSTSVLGAELRHESSEPGFKDVSDLDRPSETLREPISEGVVPGVGADANSLKELSVRRGAFQGKRRRDMQAKITAKDQMSVGCGSYFGLSYTSGAR